MQAGRLTVISGDVVLQVGQFDVQPMLHLLQLYDFTDLRSQLVFRHRQTPLK